MPVFLRHCVSICSSILFEFTSEVKSSNFLNEVVWLSLKYKKRCYVTYLKQVIFVKIWIPVMNGCVGNSNYENLINTEYSLSVYPTVHVITYSFLALERVCLVWYYRCIHGCKIVFVNSAMCRTHTKCASVVWQMNSSPRFKISYKMVTSQIPSDLHMTE